MGTYISRSTRSGYSSSGSSDGNNLAVILPSGSPVSEPSFEASGTPPELLAIRAEMEEYKSDPYIYGQLMNLYNEYASQRFSPSFFQQIGESVGDTSARQDFFNKQISGLRSGMREILEGRHTEDITSPSNQVSEYRAAGQNVDLNGGQGIEPMSPGTADNPEIDSSLQNSGASDFSFVPQIASSVVSFAMQAYQGFMSVKSMHLDNLQKEFALSSSARDLAWNVISEGVTEYMSSRPSDVSNEDKALDDILGLTPSIVQSFASRINSLPLSRRQRKYMHNIIDELVFSRDLKGDKVPTAKYQTLINDTLKRLYGSRADATQEYGRIGADAEDIAVQRFLGDDLYRPLNQLALELTNDLNHVAQLQAKYDTDYLSQANKLGLGGLSARADYASRKLQEELKASQNRITRAFREIDRKLEYNNKIGPNWKMAFQTSLAIGESMVMNQLLNASSSFHFGLNANLRNGVHDVRDTYVH